MLHQKLFIVGCPRSGTTWIQTMFARHPSVYSGPEAHLVFILRGALTSAQGLKDADARDWLLQRFDEQSRQTMGPHNYVDREPFIALLQEAGADDMTNVEQAFWVITSILDDFCRRQGTAAHELFVEKTPGHVFLAEGLLQVYPDARVIDVVRDGRDVAVSMSALAPIDEVFPADRAEQARIWVRHVEAGRALRPHPRVLEVRYEAVRGDPEGELTRMLAFAGLTAPQHLVSQIVDASDLRREQAGASPYTRKGLVGDWRNQLGADDRAVFEGIAGHLLAELGYLAPA